jgi:hypothetical protein
MYRGVCSSQTMTPRRWAGPIVFATRWCSCRSQVPARSTDGQRAFTLARVRTRADLTKPTLAMPQTKENADTVAWLMSVIEVISARSCSLARDGADGRNAPAILRTATSRVANRTRPPARRAFCSVSNALSTAAACDRSARRPCPDRHAVNVADGLAFRQHEPRARAGRACRLRL